jgi:hypothetical protein
MLSVLAALAARAQPATPNPSDAADGAPAPSTLAVGAMQIASDANLVVEGADVTVASDAIAYSYRLKNRGSADLDLTASVVLPELRAAGDDGETWTLPADDAENPVALVVTVNGAPVATTAEVGAYALGLDRLADVKAAQLPLIPFGAATEKALAGLAPEMADRLAALGVVSPRDPANPGAAVKADWLLDVTRAWRQSLPAGKTTTVGVTFSPVKAEYRLQKGDEDVIAEAKEDLCLSAATLGALLARLKSGGALQTTEFEVDLAAPARWLDNPALTIKVKKPRPDSIVSFCGMEEKSAGQPFVIGALPKDANEAKIGVAVFTPVGK